MNQVSVPPEPGSTGEAIPCLPRVWVGFLFVAAYFIAAACVGAIGGLRGYAVDEATQRWLSVTIRLSACAYWLYCVYAIHSALAEATGFLYPITPYMAAAGHFIPLYNVYWVFRWPGELVRFVNQGAGRDSILRNWPGVVFMGAIALGLVDPTLTLVVVFALGVYLTRRLRRALVARLG